MLQGFCKCTFLHLMPSPGPEIFCDGWAVGSKSSLEGVSQLLAGLWKVFSLVERAKLVSIRDCSAAWRRPSDPEQILASSLGSRAFGLASAVNTNQTVGT